MKRSHVLTSDTNHNHPSKPGNSQDRRLSLFLKIFFHVGKIFYSQLYTKAIGSAALTLTGGMTKCFEIEEWETSPVQEIFEQNLRKYLAGKLRWGCGRKSLYDWVELITTRTMKADDSWVHVFVCPLQKLHSANILLHAGLQTAELGERESILRHRPTNSCNDKTRPILTCRYDIYLHIKGKDGLSL